MKEVTLEIFAEIIQETGERQVIDLITEGGIYEKDGAYFLTYDESEMSGMAGSRTVLKIEDDGVTLNRMGLNRSKMIFKLHAPHNSIYHTPHGNFEMKIITHSLDIKMDFIHSKGYLNMKYEMILEAMSQSENTLSIKVRPSHA